MSVCVCVCLINKKQKKTDWTRLRTEGWSVLVNHGWINVFKYAQTTNLANIKCTWCGKQGTQFTNPLIHVSLNIKLKLFLFLFCVCLCVAMQPNSQIRKKRSKKNNAIESEI